MDLKYTTTTTTTLIPSTDSGRERPPPKKETCNTKHAKKSKSRNRPADPKTPSPVSSECSVCGIKLLNTPSKNHSSLLDDVIKRNNSASLFPSIEVFVVVKKQKSKKKSHRSVKVVVVVVLWGYQGITGLKKLWKNPAKQVVLEGPIEGS